MGHYVSEMGGGRLSLDDVSRYRENAKKKVEAEMEKSPLKISNFRKGNRVILRKKFNTNCNPGMAYNWDDMFCTELGIGFEKIREMTCAFKVLSVNKKEGKLKLRSNYDPFKMYPFFIMDYRLMEIVKKRA